MMKKILSILLAAALLASLSVPALAVTDGDADNARTAETTDADAVAKTAEASAVFATASASVVSAVLALSASPSVTARAGTLSEASNAAASRMLRIFFIILNTPCLVLLLSIDSSDKTRRSACRQHTNQL